MTEPRIERVEMIEDHIEQTITVVVYWAGVNRKRGHGYQLNATPRHRSVAKRLVRAMIEGAVFYDAEVRRDIDGKTYVHASSRVLGRYLNADLKKLGY